jgi:Aminoglycoside adenylyltransferase, C-terminal domain/Nucleotidyltransferase domain
MSDSTPSPLPDPVRVAVEAWLGHHDRLAPGLVEGLYLVGSAALGDWTPHSDVDIVAFVSDPTDAGVVGRLEAAHDAYRAACPGPTIDGPFLSWADVVSPPISVRRAWTLDGEFHFDAECFEINPVVWFTLVEHGIAVLGPAPGTLDVHLDDAARRAWVRRNVDTYWRGVRDEVADVLEQAPDRTAFGPAMVEWCVLGVARMWFTAETGSVASKSAAGAWAATRLQVATDVFDLAEQVRRGRGPESVDRSAVEETVNAMTEMIAAVAAVDPG